MALNQAIEITPDQRDTLVSLLSRHLPNTEAWVYGSRVRGTSRPAFDLDMVVFATPEQAREVSELRESFEESNLSARRGGSSIEAQSRDRKSLAAQPSRRGSSGGVHRILGPNASRTGDLRRSLLAISEPRLQSRNGRKGYWHVEKPSARSSKVSSCLRGSRCNSVFACLVRREGRPNDGSAALESQGIGRTGTDARPPPSQAHVRRNPASGCRKGNRGCDMIRIPVKHVFPARYRLAASIGGHWWS